MRNVAAIAYFTFIEMKRNKVLYAIFFFAIFILGLGVAITRMTIGDVLNIVSDIGLGTMEIFSTLIAIFLGISIVHKELTQKTLHPVLARPVSRPAYLLGKFFGMELTILVQVGIMSLIFLTMLAMYGGAGLFLKYIPGIYTIFLQTSMVISVAVLCSTLAEPVVAAFLTVSYYLVGATSWNLIYLVTEKSSESVRSMVRTLRYILPDFHYLNIKDNLVYGDGLKDINLISSTGYSLFSVIIVLGVAVFFFNRKELN